MDIVFVRGGGIGDVCGAEEEGVRVLFELAEVSLMDIKYLNYYIQYNIYWEV